MKGKLLLLAALALNISLTHAKCPLGYKSADGRVRLFMLEKRKVLMSFKKPLVLEKLHKFVSVKGLKKYHGEEVEFQVWDKLGHVPTK